MSSLALRDHAQGILAAICLDIEQPQSADQQLSKSKGLAPLPRDTSATAAQTHATLRARSGFDINQMVSEYRALRASVLCLWERASAPGQPDWQETIRFNEAIDAAICESVSHFSAEVNRARDLLLGVLGHDMRSPLNAIQMTAAYLQHMNAGEDVSEAAARLIRSGGRIRKLLDDLTEFNRKQLGLRMRIDRAEVDLQQVFNEQLQELVAANPHANIDLEVNGDVHGNWDAGRMHQLLGNLVTNAMQHGAAERPIRIQLSGRAESVAFTVTNEGDQIPDHALEKIFEPLHRGKNGSDQATSFGLGLYVCREVAHAHGGTIDVASSPMVTSFTVCLPRAETEAPIRELAPCAIALSEAAAPAYSASAHPSCAKLIEECR